MKTIQGTTQSYTVVLSKIDEWAQVCQTGNLFVMFWYKNTSGTWVKDETVFQPVFTTNESTSKADGKLMITA